MSLTHKDREALSGVLPDFEEVPASIQAELVDAVDRALRAGARPPLRYLGAGMTAIVLGDKVRKAYKVGRHPNEDVSKKGLATEAEWLADANTVPALRGRVVRLEKFYPWPLLVIVNEEVRRSEDGKPRGLDMWAIHQGIADAMKKKGWGRPEFKEDSYIHSSSGPVLVDASATIRFGQRLLQYARDLVSGDRPLNGERLSDLQWELRMEASDGRISEQDAAKVSAELEKLK